MIPPPPVAAGQPRTGRCWTLHGEEGAVDVEVVGRDDDHLADVLPRVRDLLGVPVHGLWSGPVRLPDDLPLGAPPLRHGAVLGLGRPVRVPPPGSGPLELRVVGGPDAGTSLALARGRHLVGRDPVCDVRIADPDISRRHLEVLVGEGAVEVRDLGSTNGSSLDSDRLDDRFRRWPPGTSLRLGATTLALDVGVEAPATVEPAPGGRSRIRPPHSLRVLREEHEVVLPRAPADPPRRRLAWVAVLLPAVGGVLLAWFLRTPTFLFFALLSPLVALGTWASERWSGRRSGRRARAAYGEELAAAHERLAAAVRADALAAEQEHPDPARIAAAVRRRTALVWSRGLPAAEPLGARLGSGPGPVRVTRVEPDGAREREPAGHLPVPVELSATGGVAVVGPREHALGALRAIIAQLVALHPPDVLAVLLLTRPDRLSDWSWARWLPHLPGDAVHVAADAGHGHAADAEPVRSRLAGLVGERTAGPVGGRVVVVVDRRLDGRTAALLRAAREAGVVLLATAERAGELPVAVDATLTLAGETGSSGVLAQDRTADRTAVLVDRISADVAGELSRGLADLLPAGPVAALPEQVRLLELTGWAVRPGAHGATDGAWSDERNALRTALGRSAEGPVHVDLCRDGPHALVAGTTGSGKSELLQSLIAGLALNHPPERCSFLLVDYKGGAAFAEAAGLPHTVGLLTDLDGSTTGRALRSLAAELVRREALLAAHGVPDIGALPPGVDLARLVIVVDEFATLVEELPGFVPGLVGIAQRGRSLGIHLVLATQRPGGVVSPEIRANCTLRICLRTTDEADSRDVLGSPVAAHLPVHLPGRAFLRTGSGAPRPLQVARVATAAAATPDPLRVRRWSWPPSAVRTGPAAAEGATDLALVVGTLSGLAARRGRPAPHRPWQPPLPDRLTADELDAAVPGDAEHRHPARLRIGLVDRPDRQAREPLELDLSAGGGVLAVGGPRSGRTTALRTVLRTATARLDPGDLHVHVIEASGGELCAEAEALPHTGTAVSGADALRTVRLLDRLGREVETRRSRPAGDPLPLLLLLVDGVEAVVALLDEADAGRGSESLLRLVRDGAAVGVTCVLTADRAMPGGRLAGAARLRLLLPLHDRADYTVAGVPPRDVPAHRPPGRALLGEEVRECQLVLPGAPVPRTAAPRDPTAAPPIRVVELPADPTLPPAPADAGAGGSGWPLQVGPGGDDGAVLEVDLERSGGLLVLGPPGSGRTTALESFAQRLAAAGAAIARLTPVHDRRQGPPHGTELDPGDPGSLRAWVDQLGGRRGVLVADDVGAAGEYAGLSGLPPMGARTGVVLLAGGSAGQLSSHFQGPLAALRRSRTGLLLRPTPGDAEALGIRLPRLPLPVRPGSGWLVAEGRPRRVQVARLPPGSALQPGG